MGAHELVTAPAGGRAVHDVQHAEQQPIRQVGQPSPDTAMIRARQRPLFEGRRWEPL